MGKEEVTDKLASGTISRRGALKLLGGTALGLRRERRNSDPH